MLDARNDVDKSLNQLDASNQDVMTEVENIQKQTQQNNESVEKSLPQLVTSPILQIRQTFYL